MRSYSHLLYRVEDSVVNNKAIQTYSAWWPECQSRGNLGQGLVVCWSGQRRHNLMGVVVVKQIKKKLNKELKKSLNITSGSCQV